MPILILISVSTVTLVWAAKPTCDASVFGTDFEIASGYCTFVNSSLPNQYSRQDAMRDACRLNTVPGAELATGETNEKWQAIVNLTKTNTSVWFHINMQQQFVTTEHLDHWYWIMDNNQTNVSIASTFTSSLHHYPVFMSSTELYGFVKWDIVTNQVMFGDGTSWSCPVICQFSLDEGPANVCLKSALTIANTGQTAPSYTKEATDSSYVNVTGVATYKCDAHHLFSTHTSSETPDTTKNVACVAAATWATAPTCDPVCAKADLTIANSGTPTYTSEATNTAYIKVNGVATYTCNPNHVFSTANTTETNVTCTAAGTWATAPTCILPNTCATPPSPDSCNSNLRGSSFKSSARLNNLKGTNAVLANHTDVPNDVMCMKLCHSDCRCLAATYKSDAQNCVLHYASPSEGCFTVVENQNALIFEEI